MTIESLAESFRAFKANSHKPGPGRSRIRYPKKLKVAATLYYRNNPGLTPSKMASLIGISPSCADKWFKGIKRNDPLDAAASQPQSFVELKTAKSLPPQTTADEIRVRIVELTIPTALDESTLFTSLKALISGAL